MVTLPPTPAPLSPAYRSALRSMQLRGACAALALLLAAGLAAAALVPLVNPWALAAAFAAGELAFAGVWLRRRAQLDVQPLLHEPLAHDGLVAFRHFLASGPRLARVMSAAELLRIWFGAGVEEGDIKRGNVADLLSYGFFYRSRATMEQQGLGEVVEEMVASVEEIWGTRFPDGVNPSLTYMDHLWAPLKALWKPGAFYLLGELLCCVKHAMLLASGFRCHQHAGFVYYTRGVAAPGAAGAAEEDTLLPGTDARVPILFCHGVGAGLLPYVPWVQRLAATGHPVIAVEFKHLAMRWTRELPTVEEVADAMAAILRLHGVAAAAVMGHSFGTFFGGRLLRSHPHLVHSLTLVDPVVACMWSGHLISTFVYRPARSSTGLSAWAISRDIHTAAAVARNFFWTEYNLFPHMLPERCLVVLSGRDDLVPVAHVTRMVQEETRAALMVHPSHPHAGWTFDGGWQEEVLARMLQVMHEGSASTGGGGNSDAAVLATSNGAHAAAAAAVAAGCVPAPAPAGAAAPPVGTRSKKAA